MKLMDISESHLRSIIRKTIIYETKMINEKDPKTKKDPKKISAGIIEITDPEQVITQAPKLLTAAIRGRKAVQALGGMEAELADIILFHAGFYSSLDDWVVAAKKDLISMYEFFKKEFDVKNSDELQAYIKEKFMEGWQEIFQRNPDRFFKVSLNKRKYITNFFLDTNQAFDKACIALLIPDNVEAVVGAAMGLLGKDVGQNVAQQIGARAGKGVSKQIASVIAIQTSKAAGKVATAVGKNVVKGAGGAFNVYEWYKVYKLVSKQMKGLAYFKELFGVTFDPRTFAIDVLGKGGASTSIAKITSTFKNHV